MNFRSSCGRSKAKLKKKMFFSVRMPSPIQNNDNEKKKLNITKDYFCFEIQKVYIYFNEHWAT